MMQLASHRSRAADGSPHDGFVQQQVHLDRASLPGDDPLPVEPDRDTVVRLFRGLIPPQAVAVVGRGDFRQVEQARQLLGSITDLAQGMDVVQADAPGFPPPDSSEPRGEEVGGYEVTSCPWRNGKARAMLRGMDAGSS